MHKIHWDINLFHSLAWIRYLSVYARVCLVQLRRLHCSFNRRLAGWKKCRYGESRAMRKSRNARRKFSQWSKPTNCVLAILDHSDEVNVLLMNTDSCSLSLSTGVLVGECQLGFISTWPVTVSYPKACSTKQQDATNAGYGRTILAISSAVWKLHDLNINPVKKYVFCFTAIQFAQRQHLLSLG